MFAVNKYFIYEGSYDCLSIVKSEANTTFNNPYSSTSYEGSVKLIFLSYQELFSFHRCKRSSSKFSVVNILHLKRSVTFVVYCSAPCIC